MKIVFGLYKPNGEELLIIGQNNFGKILINYREKNFWKDFN